MYTGLLTPSLLRLHSNAQGKQEFKHAVFDQGNETTHFTACSSTTPFPNADSVSASVKIKVDRMTRKLLKTIHATNSIPVLGEILNMTSLPSAEQKRADDRQSALKAGQIANANHASVHQLARTPAVTRSTSGTTDKQATNGPPPVTKRLDQRSMPSTESFIKGGLPVGHTSYDLDMYDCQPWIPDYEPAEY